MATGNWVNDPTKNTTNADGTINWFEYWSTDPTRTRVSKVAGGGLTGGILEPVSSTGSKNTTEPTSGNWVHDEAKDTTNPDGTINWNEYWSTDPNKKRVTKVAGSGISGTALTGNNTATATTSKKGKVVSTFINPETGDVTATFEDGSTEILAKSGAKDVANKSAYDLLYQQFNDLGIGALVPELKTFIEEGISGPEFTLRLRQTDAYKKRFAANAQRVAKGLRALSEAEYIGKEDAYQDIMRRYGLPESYYTRGEMGRQEGFEKLIAGDVSDVELEDRISTAQRRVLNANPEVAASLKAFYPGISNGDILAYTLDPSKAIEDIKRKVTAAEIGGAAARFGLTTNVSDAEYLRNYGVTKEQADQGYSTISGGLQRGSQLASMYGESPYTQATAEQEIFNVPGAAEARKQRQKITGLEKATFTGQSGLSQGALVRDRAGAY
jgi:hypothetical protein